MAVGLKWLKRLWTSVCRDERLNKTQSFLLLLSVLETRMKRQSEQRLQKVCRIPTHLFAFVEFCEGLSGGTGWGRAHRRAIQNWYNEKKGMPLAIAVTKYRQRGGWSHLDVLRLSHVKPKTDEVACVCKYTVKGMDECRAQFVGKGPEVDEVLAFLEAVEMAKSADEATLVKYIREYGLVREHIPTTHLNSISVSCDP